MSIDIKKLKRQITLKDHEKIINSLGIPIVSKSDNIWSLKSMCHHKDKNCKDNLKFKVSTLTFTCYSKGCIEGSDIIDLVQVRKQLFDDSWTFIDSLNYIIDELDLDIDKVTRISKKSKDVFNWDSYFGRYLRHENIYSEPEIYDDKILNFFPKIYPLEWIEEGISIESMQKYGIAYYPYRQATIIPCFDEDNDLVGIRGRFWHLDDIERGKYRPISLLDHTTFKFPTSMFFYGSNHNLLPIMRKKKVILVESEKAVLKSDTWFGDESIALGMYGKVLGKYRAKQLVKWGVEEVIIMIDNDFQEIGDDDYNIFVESVNRIYNLLSPYTQVKVCYNNLQYAGMYKQNPFDFDRDTYDKLWESKEIIN